MKHNSLPVAASPPTYYSELARILLQQSTDAIFIVNSEGLCVDVNLPGCALLNRDRDEILGTPLQKYSLSSGKFSSSGHAVCEHVLPDNHTLYVIRRCADERAKPAASGEGRPNERGEALAIRSERLRQITSAVPGIIYMFRQLPDSSFHIPYISARVKTLFGVSPEEVDADAANLIQRIHPADRKRLMRTVRQSALSPTPEHHEFRILHPTRGEIWVESYAIPQADEGNGTLWYGFVTEITERKAMERDLQQSRELFTKAFHSSPAASSISTLHEGRFVDVNPSFERLFGYRRDELIGRTSLELNMFTVPDARAHAVQELLKQGSLHQYEMDIRTKHGEIRNVLFSVESIQLNDKAHVLVIFLDITQRKQAEEALRKNEIHYRMLVEHAADCLFVNDEAGRLLEVNQAACQLLGYTEEEFMTMRVQDLIVPEDIDAKPLHRIEKDSNETVKTERRLRRKDNSIVHMDVRVRRLPTGRFHALARDITERKATEQALRESEARYRMLMEQAVDGVFISDVEGNYLDVNEAGCRLVGYTREELLDMHVFDLFPKEAQADFLKNLPNVLSGQALRSEGALIHKDGFIINTDMTLKLLPDSRLQAVVRDATERKLAEERLALALSAAQMGVWEWEAKSNSVFLSPECYALFGIDHFDGAMETLLSLLHPDERERIVKLLPDPLTDRAIFNTECRILHADGTVRWMSTVGQARCDTQGNPLRVVGTMQDITERKETEAAQLHLEAQLQQAQKMESIGRLAGGVAHDFNNLLTVIQMYSELMYKQMRRRLPDESSLLTKLEHIREASARATALTSQLLAFSRKQILAPTILDLNELVENLHTMLERLIGEDIHFVTWLQPELWLVMADPSQLEQVLMNLIVNARDAMPVGGTLTIRTRNVHIQAKEAKSHVDLSPGPKVMLAISDTGHGMDAGTRQRIFEPFFTTKEPGKGTGLGLATVHGIIKQSGGSIHVESELNRGTTFTIYLPTSDAQESTCNAAADLIDTQHGSEMILLVEDEEAVRDLVKVVLQDAGYTVLVAEHPLDALSLAQQYAGELELLLTDVVMPHMSGRELFDQLRARHQGMRVLFMSGYTDDAVVRHGLLTAEVDFLPKPFSPDALTAKVREVLDK